MRRILTALMLMLAAGCWTPGSIVEGLPKHSVKFPAGTAFFVDPTEPRVRQALKEALSARGFPLVEKRESADIVLSVRVERWECNTAGFSGFRDRDDMQLAVTLTDPKTRFIRARATITLRSDFRILARYVDTL